MAQPDTPNPAAPRRRTGALLTEGPVGWLLIRLAVPMLGGTFAMTAFNLADTYFVARLGTLPLAAMAFTFPVVMFVGSIAHGLGMGATSVVSRAIGRGDALTARRVTTYSMVLALLVVTVFSAVGLLTMGPVFRMLGATEGTLPLVRQFMAIWYAGIAFMMLPMMANSIMRAAGDTVYPSLVMIIGSVLNCILDPIMIFGLVGCPRMELRGAALATVLTRALTLVLALILLHSRHGLLDFSRPSLKVVWDCWRQVLHIGIPSSATNLLVPLSSMVITRIVAGFGAPAVAACGAGGRIEMFAFMIPMALGISLVPVLGQNWGAGRLDRVNLCRKYSNRFALYWGVCCAAAFMALSGPLARVFSDDPRVVDVLSLYLCIIPLGYGMREIHRYVGFSFIAIGRPMSAAAINTIRILGFLVPGILLGAWVLGLSGVFWGTLAADVASTIIAVIWAHRLFATLHDPAVDGADHPLGAGRSASRPADTT
ncbi:MAG: MATE family efflux transporter [Candidatus Hydrogenedentes bacterium]|nr:MATE family efflux transporter [Candidatus Hydrogenedentota bacterium]